MWALFTSSLGRIWISLYANQCLKIFIFLLIKYSWHGVGFSNNFSYLPSLIVHISNINPWLKKLKLKIQPRPLQKLDGSEYE